MRELALRWGLGDIIGVGALIRARVIREGSYFDGGEGEVSFKFFFFWASSVSLAFPLTCSARVGICFFFAWTFEIEFLLHFDRGFVLLAWAHVLTYLWFWYALMVLRVGLEGLKGKHNHLTNTARN